MLSKYGILCEVASRGSFTAVAALYGYAQSSVSQAVKAVEDELGVCLIDRRRHGITWTDSGKEYEPYLRAIYAAEQALERKQREMSGLKNATIRIGSFTSVSRDILPHLMMEFKKKYPDVSFELRQGDYNNIHDWLQGGIVDIGFLAIEVAGELVSDILYEDEMMAVLPRDHPLSYYDKVSLEQLAKERFILLDEGQYSTTLNAFANKGISLRAEYRVYDDYSILSMIKSKLGVSLLFSNVISGYENEVAIRPLAQPITRKICLACCDPKTLSYASRKFRVFTINHLKSL